MGGRKKCAAWVKLAKATIPVGVCAIKIACNRVFVVFVTCLNDLFEPEFPGLAPPLKAPVASVLTPS